MYEKKSSLTRLQINISEAKLKHSLYRMLVSEKRIVQPVVYKTVRGVYKVL